MSAACELARHGIAARVVDHEMEPHHQARATVIQPATLEIFARAGLVDEFLRSAVHVEKSRVCGPRLVTLAQSCFASIDCAYEFQCCLPQWRTEEIFVTYLEQFGVPVERGKTVISYLCRVN